MRWRRRQVILILAVTLVLVGCSDDTTSIDSDRDMIDALERAGITCPEWDSFRGRGDEHDTNTCEDSTSGFVGFRQEASAADAKLSTAVGQENARCIRRQWSLNSDDPTAPEITANLLWQSWGVWGSSDAIEALQEEIGGEVFAADDPPPTGVSEVDFRHYADTEECGPIPAFGAEAEPTPSAPEASMSTPPPSDEPCVENCTWSVADVIRDLDGILCKSQDSYATLQGDITDQDRLQTGADKILVCENGGSNDLSSFGIVYIWRDYGDMSAARASVAGCDEPGLTAPPAVTVYGGNDGNPGYVVANVQSGDEVVTWLVEGGAKVLCE